MAFEKIGSLVSSLYEPEPKMPLFHYTSLQAYLSIAKNKQLWATEVRYLNDEHEMKYFVGQMNIAQMYLETDSDTQKIADQFSEWRTHRVLHNNGNLLFVISLSEVGNLLSQWRSYTQVNQGVSIGFDADGIHNLAVQQGYLLGKCIYSNHEAQRVCLELTKHVIAHAKSVGPAPSAHPSESYFHAFYDVEEDILAAAALFKNPAFQEEQEWRLVSQSVSNFGTAAIHYRVGPSALVPYKEFELVRGIVSGPIHSIIVGPCENSSLSVASIFQVLTRSNLGVPGKSVGPCNIPLRTTK